MNKTIIPIPGMDVPLGVSIREEGLNIACELRAVKECGIRIRKIGSDKVEIIPFSDELRRGALYCVCLPLEDAPEKYEYSFYADGKWVPDIYAKQFSPSMQDSLKWGCNHGEEWYSVEPKTYDWADDRNPRLAYENSVFYALHVRGFTKHSSSGCKNKGTFAGIAEKIPYLTELGVTTLEVMPLYEFDEIIRPSADQAYMQARYMECEPVKEQKLNYWGYCDAHYYMPKFAYSATGDPAFELKDLICNLHRNNMELIMQIYFGERTSYRMIEEVLRYWVREYHVDGFHLFGSDLPMKEITTDPYLADVKLIYYGFDTQNEYALSGGMRRFALYEDHYMDLMRCFLKGDNDTIEEALRLIRNNPDKVATLNCLTRHDTMTIADMVSYDKKHNEDNGENNADGRDYNYSWNCGVEGPTRKKQVVELRARMMRNAMTVLILSAGTPYITAGDEFARSTGGNNNPYCQDNEINWLNWNLLKTNASYVEYVRKILNLRKECAIFRKSREYSMMDTTGCGFPDLSIHSDEAWRAKLNNYDHTMGLMYCGRNGSADNIWYIAYNMYWQEADLAMPKLPKGLRWSLYCDTANSAEADVVIDETDKMQVPARSIRIMRAVAATNTTSGAKTVVRKKTAPKKK